MIPILGPPSIPNQYLELQIIGIPHDLEIAYI